MSRVLKRVSMDSNIRWKWTKENLVNVLIMAIVECWLLDWISSSGLIGMIDCVDDFLLPQFFLSQSRIFLSSSELFFSALLIRKISSIDPLFDISFFLVVHWWIVLHVNGSPSLSVASVSFQMKFSTEQRTRHFQTTFDRFDGSVEMTLLIGFPSSTVVVLPDRDDIDHSMSLMQMNQQLESFHFDEITSPVNFRTVSILIGKTVAKIFIVSPGWTEWEMFFNRC